MGERKDQEKAKRCGYFNEAKKKMQIRRDNLTGEIYMRIHELKRGIRQPEITWKKESRIWKP